MPFYLKDRDFSLEIIGAQSALIVPCRFCPAASLAIRERKPYLELSLKFFRSPAFDAYIQALKSGLEKEGIRIGVYENKSPGQYVVCMWDAKRRKDLARYAGGYDALIVLGCGAAVEVARQCSNSSNCRIIPGMEAEGIMNVIPTFQFPFKISLEMMSMTRILQQDTVTSKL